MITANFPDTADAVARVPSEILTYGCFENLIDQGMVCTKYEDVE